MIFSYILLNLYATELYYILCRFTYSHMYTIMYRLPKNTTRILPYDYDITEHTLIDTIRKYIIDLNKDLPGDIQLLYDGMVLDNLAQVGNTALPKYYNGILLIVVGKLT